MSWTEDWTNRSERKRRNLPINVKSVIPLHMAKLSYYNLFAKK